jgi:FMN-dependent NADH-azoreductase
MQSDNFKRTLTLPAIVKAWFDSMIQRVVTFGRRKDGQKVSNNEKKALTLVSCGEVYSNESSSIREHALSLSSWCVTIFKYCSHYR